MFSPQVLVFMIPIVAIVMGISAGIVSTIVNYRKRKEMFAMHHQERMAAIEKGIEVPPLPPEFFTEDLRQAGPPSPHRTLLTGLVLLFLGAAVTVSLYVELHSNYIWGLIPASIGAAFLIYYFAVGRKHAEEMERRRYQASASGSTRVS